MFELKYKCTCGEHSFKVRYRHKNEDIIQWMESVVRPGMAKAHAAKSPLCIQIFCDLMIPINEAAKGIGMETEH